MKPSLQVSVIYRLRKVTQDPVVQGALSDSLIRVGGNENCRDRVSRIDEARLELNSTHSRHLDVGNKAGGFSKKRRCQERRRGGEHLDGVTHEHYDPSHGFAEGLIVLDDRDERAFRHQGFRRFSLTANVPAPNCQVLVMASLSVRQGSRQSNVNCLSLGLPRRLSAYVQRLSRLTGFGYKQRRPATRTRP